MSILQSVSPSYPVGLLLSQPGLGPALQSSTETTHRQAQHTTTAPGYTAINHANDPSPVLTIQTQVKTAATVTLTVAIGASGGALMSHLNGPLPWLLGSLLATVLVSLIGLKTRLPLPLRNMGLAVLGTAIGCGFRANIVETALQWIPTMLAMMAVVAVIVPLAYVIYRKYSGWSKITSVLAAIPGGFATMAITAEELGGDVSKVSTAHMFRIVTIIMFMPVLVGLLYEQPQQTNNVAVTAQNWAGLSVLDICILIACTVAGPWIGKKLRLPASVILGALALSALVHMLEFNDAAVPREVIWAVQVTTGCWLGANLASIKKEELANVLGVSLLVTVLTLVPTFGIAWFISDRFGFELVPLILAFAPGGMPEMALIALAFNLDPMFVIGHHMVRMLVLILFGPVLLSWLHARASVANKRKLDDTPT